MTHKTSVYIPQLILTRERFLYSVLVLKQNVNVLVWVTENHHTKRWSWLRSEKQNQKIIWRLWWL